MAALDNDPEPLDFATLKAISGATDGNLGAHLQTLEKAGLISISKEVIGRRNRTWVSLTVSGISGMVFLRIIVRGRLLESIILM